jgi:hypothetical protein
LKIGLSLLESLELFFLLFSLVSQDEKLDFEGILKILQLFFELFSFLHFLS